MSVSVPVVVVAQQVAAYLCGVLLNLVSGDDGESSAARHTFVKAGGMEVTCQVSGGQRLEALMHHS